MRRIRNVAGWVLSAWAVVSCGGGGGGGSPGPQAPTLQSIAVTPATLTAGVGGGHPLHATGTYSDGSTKDLTASATWSIATSTVATVSGGIVTGVAAGTATVSAASGGVSGSSAITILNDTWRPAATSPLTSGNVGALLKSGAVLVVDGDPYTPRAALYNPATDSWTQTPAPSTGRYGATATLLADGRVLVVGGTVLDTATGHSRFLSSVEIYDPAANAWSTAAAMPAAREYHAAVLLPDGKVLVVGGDDGTQPPMDALLYDPAANTWTATTPVQLIGLAPTATLLKSGKVLVTSSVGAPPFPGFSELYDPSSNSWAYGPGTQTPHVLGATATLLNDGRVLLVGGQVGGSFFSAMASPEVYDPSANAWSGAGTMVAGRQWHSAVLLPSGKVFAAGGFATPLGGASLASTELFDPATNAWSPGKDMAPPRDHFVAVLLPAGAVFVTGGVNQGATQNSSAWYW